MSSILTTIKKVVGVEESYTHFDPDIIVHINTALYELRKLGIGPVEGFVVTSSAEEWSDYLGDTNLLESVKTYVYLSVRLAFDPPPTSFAIEAYVKMKEKIEWHLSNE